LVIWNRLQTTSYEAFRPAGLYIGDKNDHTKNSCFTFYVIVALGDNEIEWLGGNILTENRGSTICDNCVAPSGRNVTDYMVDKSSNEATPASINRI
jgi:hypothetical protein